MPISDEGHWVLLRGLARGSGHWGEFPDVLQRLLPRARLTRLDIAGNGARYRERSPVRIESIAADCRETLARRAPSDPGPIVLLALSMGAMVAIEWARAHPDQIQGCVLINTSLRPFSPAYRRLNPSSLVALIATLRPRRSATAIEQSVLERTSRICIQPDSTIRQWVRLRQSEPVSRANACRQVLAAARYHAPSRPPGQPLLLLASRRDALVDSRCSQDIASRWGVPIDWHPEAGHDLPLDDPHWVAARVATWWHAGPGARDWPGDQEANREAG